MGQHTLLFLSSVFYPFFPRVSTNHGRFPDVEHWPVAGWGRAACLLSLDHTSASCSPQAPAASAAEQNAGEAVAVEAPDTSLSSSPTRSHVLHGTPVSRAQKPRMALSARVARGVLHNAGANIFTGTWAEHTLVKSPIPHAPHAACSVGGHVTIKVPLHYKGVIFLV